jgi:MYXO-CTERM domain-containing protein
VTPQTWTPGDEIAITLELNATTPGIATVLFLLDGLQLGDPAATRTGTTATFTRVLPSDLSVGSHRIELVDAEDPSQPLASRTVGVAATDAGGVTLPQPNSPATAGTNPSVVPTLVGIAGLLGLGALAWHYRRRWIPRRGL